MLDHSSKSVVPAAADPLTDMLRGLRLDGLEYRRRELDAPWAFSFQAQADAYFHFIGERACWLRSPAGEWLELKAGDAVLLPHGSKHALASAPDAIAQPFLPWQDEPTDDQVSDFRAGEDGPRWRLFHGAMRFNVDSRHPLLRLMPDVMTVSALAKDEPTIPSMLEAMASEMAANRVGACSIVCRLADVLAAHIIRSWVQHGCGNATGWIAAVRRPDIGRVLAGIHADPAHDWSVSSLASVMGASRSSFASKFAEVVGETPLRYVAQVRMHQARQWIVRDRARIADVAQRLGYDSEASFSRAFKRVIGAPPSHYRVGPGSQRDS